MKKWIVLFGFVVSLFGTEKFFIVERENSSLAIIEESKVTERIVNMKDMNHGVVKFHAKDGYAITRDGYVLRFNPQTNKILNEYKTSKSAIGFVVEDDFVAVANYDDKSVDILTKDLKPLQKIVTNSRNVGIKTYKNYLVFAQMDTDKLTILKRDPKRKPFFVPFKEFEDVGIMPFDAMLDNQNYIVGFFKSPYFGVIDLEKMNFSQIKILTQNNQPVLKVPHFGFWSLGGQQVFIPAVGDNKVLVYDNKFNFIKNITTIGLPVFTALSPDKRYLAVTFSGEKFPVIQIIDTKTLEVLKEFNFDGKVLHVRWSEEKPHLYVSVNDTNKIAVINTNDWFVSKEIFGVKKPSGIFIYREKK